VRIFNDPLPQFLLASRLAEKITYKTKVPSNCSTVIVQYLSEGTAGVDINWKET